MVIALVPKSTIEDYICVFKPGQGSRVTKLLEGKTIMSLGSTAKLARMAGSSLGHSEHKIPISSIESIQIELISRAKKAGMTPEIRDLIETFDESRKILIKKNFELNILETLAMESTDENISDLREQLFTTVKLVHPEIINEMMIQEYKEDALEPFDWGDADTDMHIDMGYDRNKLHQKIRTWYFKKKEMRNKLKQYKKNLKIKMNIEGY